MKRLFRIITAMLMALFIIINFTAPASAAAKQTYYIQGVEKTLTVGKKMYAIWDKTKHYITPLANGTYKITGIKTKREFIHIGTYYFEKTDSCSVIEKNAFKGSNIAGAVIGTLDNRMDKSKYPNASNKIVVKKNAFKDCKRLGVINAIGNVIFKANAVPNQKRSILIIIIPDKDGNLPVFEKNSLKGCKDINFQMERWPAGADKEAYEAMLRASGARKIETEYYNNAN